MDLELQLPFNPFLSAEKLCQLVTEAVPMLTLLSVGKSFSIKTEVFCVQISLKEHHSRGAVFPSQSPHLRSWNNRDNPKRPESHPPSVWGIALLTIMKLSEHLGCPYTFSKEGIRIKTRASPLPADGWLVHSAFASPFKLFLGAPAVGRNQRNFQTPVEVRKLVLSTAGPRFRV